MDKKKVLVVDDDKSIHEFLATRMKDKVVLLKALTLQQGEELFNANPDISVVVIDACVPGNQPNSQWLVRKIRKTFVDLPIIAISSVNAYQQKLLLAGCSHECDKMSIPEKLLEFLNLQED